MKIGQTDFCLKLSDRQTVGRMWSAHKWLIIYFYKDRMKHKRYIWVYYCVSCLEINRDKLKYIVLVCFLIRMQGKVVMRRELTGLSDIWHS